jgi:tetratricopeptide (TPR) repeat protein
MRRFDLFGKVEDIDEAIIRLRKAITLGGNLSEFFSHLGHALKSRSKRFGEVKDIEEAITRLREAVQLTQSDDTTLPSKLNILGLALIHRFHRFEELKDIDEAIMHHREAVRLTPLDNPSLPMLLTNLGLSFISRYKHFKEVKDLDEAIKQLREAIRTMPPDSAYMNMLRGHLGYLLMVRFERFGEARDIDEAIMLHQDALQLMPPEHPSLSQLIANLGSSFQDRFKRFGEMKDIDEAIISHRKAVRLTPVNDPSLSNFLTDLGDSLTARFLRYGDVKDLDEAIEKEREAVRLMPLDDPSLCRILSYLARSFEVRFKRFGDARDLDEAVSNLRVAGQSSQSRPHHRFHASHALAALTHSVNDLQSALAAYLQAVDLLPLVAWIGLGANAQLEQLASYPQSFIFDAAACAIELASRHPDSRQKYLGQAVQFLDHGRSVMWSQASSLRTELDNIRKLDEGLALELEQTVHELSRGVFHDNQAPVAEEEAQAYHRAAEKHSQLIEQVRKLPGHDRFLLPLLITELEQAATGGHVVIFNISQYRCDVLFVRQGKPIDLVPLPEVTLKNIEDLANGELVFQVDVVIPLISD